jgi:hypothetical protein
LPRCRPAAARYGLNESTNRYWGYVGSTLSVKTGWPMNVSVRYKRGQRWSRSTARASVLGDGLLERVRSTSLALLGLTGAVGLAMVALALNQGWPLIAGAPIPGFEDKHQAAGDAVIAAEAKAPGGRDATPGLIAGQQALKASPHRSRRGAGGTPAPAGPRSPGSESIVVSHSTPASSPGSASPDAEAPPVPAPAAQQPTTTPVSAPAPEPTAVQVDTPSSPTAQSSPESSTPSRSALDIDDGERDHGNHFGRGGGRRNDHSRDRGDPDPPESTEEPEPAPSSPATPADGSDTPEEPESPSAPSWGHGDGHGHGHDYGRGHGHW